MARETERERQAAQVLLDLIVAEPDEPDGDPTAYATAAQALADDRIVLINDDGTVDISALLGGARFLVSTMIKVTAETLDEGEMVYLSALREIVDQKLGYHTGIPTAEGPAAE